MLTMIMTLIMKKTGCFVASQIEIGENVWVGANTVILRGTKIGNNCVIGAGSVIKGIIPANSIIIQKRNQIVRQR